MTLGTLTKTLTAEGEALQGTVQLGRDRLPFALLPSGEPHPQAPLYRAFVLCSCCGEADCVGSAWWKKGRKGGRSFLLITLDRGGIDRRTTLIATPNGDGTYAVTPRRARKLQAA